MANVKFLRGLQAALPRDGAGVQDGVFYLTTDTNRLYIGQGTTKKLLNQTVQIVASISDLTDLSTSWQNNGTSNSHINDFYYISGGNILAVYTGTGPDGGWKQINPDTNTKLNSTSLTATSTQADDVTLTFDAEDSDGTQGLDSSVHFVGDGSAHVTVDNGNIKITGDNYTLSSPTVSADNKTATVTLTNSNNASLNSSLIIESSNPSALRIEKDNNKIKLVPHSASLSGGSADAEVTVNNGNLGVSITDSDGGSVSSTAQRIGIALNDGTYAPITQSATGTNTGAIYSKTEIDQKLAGLDGMTYKGTIGASGATVTTLPTSGVKNGDVYVIITAGYNNFGTGVVIDSDTNFTTSGVRIGDMLIAKGTESAQTVNGHTDYYVTSGSLSWTYIPSGNDSLDLVTYTADINETTHSASLVNENSETVIEHNLVAGNDIELTSSKTSGGNRTDNILTTTIQHATINTTTAPATTLTNYNKEFTAIKSITVNNGHVTAITTDTFKPIEYELKGATVAATSNNSFNNETNTGTSDIGVTFALDNNNSDADLQSQATLNINSSSIHITAGNNGTVVMNLEWGSF